MSALDRWLKRALDLLCAGAGLLLLAPLIAVCWLVASIDTRSNGLFKQQRVGRYGKLFMVYKIKTMHDGDPGPGRSPITSENLAAISRSGRILRKYKLDELPQLFNVLFGSMSLVGPRPDVPSYADCLRGDDRVLLLLRPGITGPASLKYRDEEALLAAASDPRWYNDQVIWPDKVRINKDYYHHYSLAADLRYIVLTLFG